MPTPADEGPHEPDGDPLFNESWYFDFAAADGSLGGYARLGLYPNQRVAWYWAVLVGTDRPMLLVRDHEVPLPRGRPRDPQRRAVGRMQRRDPLGALVARAGGVRRRPR